MAERDRFELDLAAALRAYAEGAPTQVHPTQLARHFAATYPHGRTAIGPWRPAAIPRLAWVLLLLTALLAALVAGMLVVGSQPARKLPALVPPVVPPTVLPIPSATALPSSAPPTAPGAVATRPTDQVDGLAFAADGSLWLATGAGVIHWDVATATARLYGQNDGLPTTDAAHVAVAPDGTVWAAGGWLARFDGGWTSYSKASDLGGVQIADLGGMAVGADGRVWAAVSGSGGGEGKLLRFDGTWTAIDVPGSIGANSSPWGFALTVAPDGTLWAATPDGVAAFDGTTWTSYSKANTGLPRTPWLAGVARDGSPWVALSAEGCTVWTGCAVPSAGVARFDGSSWTVYTTADGLASDDADPFIGPGGDVWITYPTLPGMVSRLEGGRWVTMQLPELAGATGLAVAPDGALWLHATDGFLRFDGSTVTRHSLPTVDAPLALPSLELTLASGPTTTASALGTITWRGYESPNQYYLRAVGTPHGPVAINEVDLRWLTPSGSWAGATLPIAAPWGVNPAGDDVIVSRQAAVRLGWDGTRWVPGDALDLPSSLGLIYRVAAGPRGTVLVGASSVAWSTDGRHFADALRGPGPDGAGTGETVAPNMVSIGPVFATQEGFVALVPRTDVGWGGPFPEPVPWFSADGSKWNPVTSESPFGAGSSVFDVAGRNGRYVAVGEAGAVWVSDDGLSWERLPALEWPPTCALGDCTKQLVDVAADESGWMIVSRDGVAWTSSDGRTWEALRGWPAVRGGWAPPSLALGGGAIVVSGMSVDGAGSVVVVGTIGP